MMLQLAWLAARIATWFPISFMPDQVVAKQLKRFFASADRLAGLRVAGMRQTLNLHELTALPGKIRRWFAALPAPAYGDGSPQQGQDLADGMQILGDRLRELVTLRVAAQSEVLVRELAPDMQSWRGGIQEVVRGLYQDPQASTIRNIAPGWTPSWRPWRPASRAC